MEKLLARQAIIAEAIKKVAVNVKKDGGSRKTVEYANKRLEILRTHWQEFETNHNALTGVQDKSDSYFTTDLYNAVRVFYETTRTALISIARDPGTTTKGEKSEEATESNELSILLDKQRTNFRAFMRVVQGIRSSTLTEKWEVEDKLQMLQSRWKIVDDTHWQIDNANIGADVDYEQEFTEHETTYESTKKELNKSLNASRHIHQAVPQIEIPAFSGNYAQWPTFLDLYTEAIHRNSNLTKAQKMQHLKGKLKGEAERLVQHLNISADNYDTCWDLLIRRYNNLQLLFTKQIQLFIRQPVIQKQDAFEIKRLHDITMESINAIHNLGIDTTTWDPILVHIITEKMDPDTYTAYMEARKNPRELPSFDELMNFLDNRFTALEPVDRKTKSGHATKPYQHQAPVKEFSAKSLPRQEKPSKPWHPKAYHAAFVKTCPFCKAEHILLHCSTFQGMTPDEKMNTISRLNICVNCMYCHDGKKCNSNKRCRVCSDPHHTSLHDVAKESRPVGNPIVNKPTCSLSPKANHVSGNFDEVLLATVEVEVKANDGTYTRLRCLLDQGSQINLITESAAQRLGLQRQKQAATISGIGITAAKSNGVVQLLCKSIYTDYTFTTEALVMSKMLNNLPNATFDKQSWPHLHNINLADPEYNVSRPVDMLLDAGVYAEIVMEGVLRGPISAPIAQQTKIGWVLMGNVKTFNCNVVMANIEEISRFWEMEEITDISQPKTPEVDYCEALYQQTTIRRPDGRYEVRIPMKPDFNRELGESKPQAIAQFCQREKFCLAAFRRFCSRRGRPQKMYSDNGTNFIGAAKTLLKQQNEILQSCVNKDVMDAVADMEVQWHFNAPVWPSAGGLWERAVRSLKHHLKRVLGEQKLTFEEFSTLLAQIEACLNSRPLVPLTSDVDDLDCLTPGHFLVGGPVLANPPSSDDYVRDIRNRWKLTEKMHRDFWRRWSVEYLHTLQVRGKWKSVTDNLQTGDVVLVKEDNLPPAKWLLARVMETHPGEDGRVRVVSVKTKNSILKRPVTKLSRLPVENIEADTLKQAATATISSINNECPPKPSTNYRNPKNVSHQSRGLGTCMSTLLLLLMCIAPTIQQSVNVTKVQQTIYFDNISTMRLIKDEWKLVVYYNMSTYLQGLSDVRDYVTHLKRISTGREIQYRNVVLQLEHELVELEHYNHALYNNNKRQRRGLVNGVGYLANTLFGVLDDRFAEQYKKDIEKVEHNENHLRALIKNQTTVIESEYNILRRNEAVMNQQFGYIKQHLVNLTAQVRLNNQNELYITSSALAATIILSNLRRIQHTLLDTVADVTNGHIDTTLLSPEQLEEQANMISNHLPDGLSLPGDYTDVKDLYKLLKVHAKVYEGYLIIELGVPLVDSNMYQLDQILTVPQKQAGHMVQIQPAYPYIAFNLQKDDAIFLTQTDLTSCLHDANHNKLCSIDKPIHNLRITTMCDVTIADMDITQSHMCERITLPCEDRWIRLHRRNVWLFACCEDCKMRIFCTTGTPVVRSLSGSGIITIAPGCILKTKNVTITTHSDYISHVHHQMDKLVLNQPSTLNLVLNTTYEVDPAKTEEQEDWQTLKAQIDRIKSESEPKLSVHDIHQYAVQYTIVGTLLTTAAAYICWRMKRRQRGSPPPQEPHPEEPRATDDVPTPPAVAAKPAVKFWIPTP